MSGPPSAGATSSSERRKEQIKLGAAYLNGLAIGLFLVGGLSIPATILINATGRTGTLAAIGVGVFCVVASPIIHLVARKLLEELDR